MRYKEIQKHESYLKRTFALAKQGIGRVSPNPLVGAVIVRDQKIISEAFHHEFGGKHAEVLALEKCPNPRGATLYVNLEPCGTWGQNPPCAQKIIESGISKVVFSMNDPNPKNFQKGEIELRKNGVQIEKNILEKEAQHLNRFFVKFMKKKVPYVTIKSAMSLDGKIADSVGNSRWISGEKSRKKVHKLRHEYDAILVGRKTILADNPQLDVREMRGKNPIKILLDPEMKIPPSSKVFSKGKVFWTVKENKNHFPTPNSQSLEIEILEVGKEFSLKRILTLLGKKNITSVLVEGGGETNARFFQEDLVDEFFFFLSPKIIGGKGSSTPFDGQGLLLEKAKIAKDLKIKKSGEDFLAHGFFY